MSYEFEWDEAKRIANVAKHGVDFLDAAEVFFSRHIAATATTVGGEKRHLIVGQLFGRYVTVVFTMRSGVVRLISARSARREERRRYQTVFGGRTEENAGER